MHPLQPSSTFIFSCFHPLSFSPTFSSVLARPWLYHDRKAKCFFFCHCTRVSFPVLVSVGGGCCLQYLARNQCIRDTSSQDVKMVELLGCLDAPSLCRLAFVSRALYVFSHMDDLWKGLLVQARGSGTLALLAWYPFSFPTLSSYQLQNTFPCETL